MTRHDVASHRRTARPRGGGDRRRSAIHRLYLRGPDAPRTAIAKRLKPRPADDPGGDDSLQLFISELSSLRFLSTLDSAGIAPRLYGDDPTAHLLVMLDLGERPSLADQLLASDDDATVDALAAYARGLARLHGMSIRPVDKFRRIRAELGAPADDALWLRDAGSVVDGIEETLAAQGIPLDAPTRTELADLRGRLTGGASRPTFTHGDPRPDNNAITTGGDLVHFDFEFARVRPAMIDAAYLTVPFPTCWCVNASPPEVRARALRVYCDELATWLPAAAADNDWGISTWRQRLIYRLPLFVDLARRADALPGLAEMAESLHRRLTGRWADLAPMPTYPSLR